MKRPSPLRRGAWALAFSWPVKITVAGAATTVAVGASASCKGHLASNDVRHEGSAGVIIPWRLESFLLQTATVLQHVNASHDQEDPGGQQQMASAHNASLQQYKSLELALAAGQIVPSGFDSGLPESWYTEVLGIAWPHDELSAGVMLRDLRAATRAAFYMSQTRGRAAIQMHQTGGEIWHVNHEPIFPKRGEHKPRDGDEGFSFFSSASWQQWAFLLLITVAAFTFDLMVLQKLPDKLVWHLGVVAMWILVAVAYNIEIIATRGWDQGLAWFTGYLLEWILAVDNLFVFNLIFECYKTPPNQMHKAVCLGILGALFVRMGFYMVISTLLSVAHWTRIPVSLLLIWSGVNFAVTGQEDETELRDRFTVRFLKRILGSRLKEEYVPGFGMITWDRSGKLQLTMLFVVVLVLEGTDVLFAVDCVAAKIAQIPNSFIAFSSSVLAMFGTRGLFFVIKALVQAFDLLQYGLCVILIFIGCQLFLANYVSISPRTASIIIACIIAVSVVASIGKAYHLPSRAPGQHAAGKQDPKELLPAEKQLVAAG